MIGNTERAGLDRLLAESDDKLVSIAWRLRDGRGDAGGWVALGLRWDEPLPPWTAVLISRGLVQVNLDHEAGAWSIRPTALGLLKAGADDLIDPAQVVALDYTNYRGERRMRRIVPSGAPVFEENRYHKPVQWILPAVDMDGRAERGYALKDMHSWDSETEQKG